MIRALAGATYSVTLMQLSLRRRRYVPQTYALFCDISFDGHTGKGKPFQPKASRKAGPAI